MRRFFAGRRVERQKTIFFSPRRAFFIAKKTFLWYIKKMLKEIVSRKNARLSDLIREQTDLGFYQIKKIIENKSVKVNGKRVNTDVVVKDTDVIYIYIKDREKDKIEIVYEDKNVMVVNKPANIEVEGPDGLKERIEVANAEKTLYPVHRLDRNTMGLVIFALTQQAQAELDKAFKEKLVDKYYHAIVVGRPKQQTATLKAFLFKDAKKSLAIISNEPKSGYLPIETRYRLLESKGELSLLEVQLITGRTHQIRAHLAHEKLAVLGDGKYGSNQINKKYKQNRQLLANVLMRFNFPKNSCLAYLNKQNFKLDINLWRFID